MFWDIASCPHWTMLHSGDWGGGDREGGDGRLKRLKDLIDFHIWEFSWQGLPRQSKSVIHSLSLKKQFFSEPYAVIHLINKHWIHPRHWAWIGQDTYTTSKPGKLAVVVFKQLLNQDSPKVFTSNISSCWPHSSNTKVGTSSFREELHYLYNCARSVKDTHRVDGISSLCSKCPAAFSLPLPMVLEEGCCLAPTLSLSVLPPPPLTPQAGSCH